MKAELPQHQRHLVTEESSVQLRALFTRAYEEIPFYRAIFETEKITPHDNPIEVLTRFPVLDSQGYVELQKDIFRNLGAKRFLTEYTSGTTGPRKIRFTTIQDEMAEEDLCVRFFRQCGIGPHDRVLALDIDSADIYLFYARAMKKLGVTNFAFFSIRAGSYRNVEGALQLRPTVILSVPSLLRRCHTTLTQTLSRECQSGLSKIIYIGETMSESLRQVLAEQLGVELYSFFGSTEIGSVGGECSRHTGIHLYNDSVIPTILTPVENNTAISGEVVWTTLHFQDQPLIKYATRDWVSISKRSCPCGSPFPLMETVSRTEDQFVICGYKFKYEVFHQALEREYGPLEFLAFEIDSLNGKDIVKCVLPESLRASKDAIMKTIRQTDDIGYFTRMNFLDYSIEFRPARFYRQRKLTRVLDRRNGAHSGTAKCRHATTLRSLTVGDFGNTSQ